MKMARLQVSPELLRAVLLLPENVTISDARIGEHYGEIELTLIGDSLPVEDIKEGDRLPLVMERVKATWHECGHSTLTVEWEKAVAWVHLPVEDVHGTAFKMHAQNPAVESRPSQSGQQEE